MIAVYTMRMKFLTFLLCCFFASSSFAAGWDYTLPVPLKAGGGARGRTPNANNILFFEHGAVPNSQRNFKEEPSVLNYRGLQIEALDLVGAPGFPPPSPSGPIDIPTRIRAMLADPMGLCFEAIFPNLVCSEADLSNAAFNTESWNLLVADLRNTFPGEQNIAGVEIPEVILEGDADASPYEQFSLGSVKIAALDPGAFPSGTPDAICYDVTQAEDFIACPVFGKIVILDMDQNAARPLMLQSPILLYRRGEDSLYHFIGHLTNPSLDQALVLRDPNQALNFRVGTQHFPVAIEHGNFNEYRGTENQQDIAVFSTATLPHLHCNTYNLLLQQARLDPLPHGLKCSYGYVWTRVVPDWRQPMSTFSATDFLIGPPRVYDLAAGRDGNQDVLFAPSNAPDGQGRFWIYKYYEIPPSNPVGGVGAIFFERLVLPRPIAATPPPGLNGYGPFKIDAQDVNNDGRADFAITWKRVEAGLIDAEHNIWKSSYSSYVSLFLSRIVNQTVNYDQFNYQVPRLNAPQPNPETELAAVTFGEKNGNLFLAVGDNRRVSVNGDFHAFVYTFPINGGVIDNLNVTSHRATFREAEASAPGVGDLTADFEKGVIGVVVRDPFIPAPESCDLRNGVYGIHWTGEGVVSFQELALLAQRPDARLSFSTRIPGVPNRCACDKAGVEPNLQNDLDFDELVDDPRCDSCPGAFNIGDLEPAVPDAEGPEREQGDGTDDVCDKCPQSFCNSRRGVLGFEDIDCRDPQQLDRDQDGVGDECDLCIDKPNPGQQALYFYRLAPGVDPQFCWDCANGFIRNGREFFLDFIGYDCSRPAGDPGSIDEQFDFDQDGVPNARDNCVYISNGENNQRFDRDQDGSGDVCDCADDQAGLGDDCDGDLIPNRFDSTPLPPRRADLLRQDFIYDPTPDFIASAKDLHVAQAVAPDLKNIEEGLFQLPERLRQINPDWRLVGPNGFQGLVASPERERVVIQAQVMGGALRRNVAPCLFPNSFFPGPIPCNFMGREPRELNALLPLQVLPPQRRPGQPPPAASPLACIARVGRTDPKAVALFEADQKRITEANNKIQSITGITDFDIFVGGEGGIIHWECVFPGGALPNANIAAAASIIPNVSGNFAPYGVWQIAGLPPLVYERKSNLGLLVAEGKAVRLAPLDVIPEGEEAVGAPAIVRYPVPELSDVAPHRREEMFPTVGVQMGSGGLRENINGQMLISVLNSESDASAAGASLSAGATQSLFVIDYKAPPECFMQKPIEERKYRFETVYTELERRVAYLRSQGKPVTLEVYEDLPWESCMFSQFLVVQNTIPEARAQVVAGAQGGGAAAQDAVNHVILPAIILPPGMTVVGGGEGCALVAEASLEEAIVWAAFWLWIFPIPAFVYLRKRSKNL